MPACCVGQRLAVGAAAVYSCCFCWMLPGRQPGPFPPHPCLPDPRTPPHAPCNPHPQCLSWLFSPILAGGFALLLFFLIRTFVLRSSDAYRRSIVLLPVFTFLTFWIVTFFVIAKAGLQFGWEKTPNGKKAWIASIVAAGTCLISIVVGIPVLRRKVARDVEAAEQ